MVELSLTYTRLRQRLTCSCPPPVSSPQCLGSQACASVVAWSAERGQAYPGPLLVRSGEGLVTGCGVSAYGCGVVDAAGPPGYLFGMLAVERATTTTSP